MSGIVIKPYEFFLITDFIVLHKTDLTHDIILFLDENSYIKEYEYHRDIKNYFIVFGKYYIINYLNRFIYL